MSIFFSGTCQQAWSGIVELDLRFVLRPRDCSRVTPSSFPVAGCRIQQETQRNPGSQKAPQCST